MTAVDEKTTAPGDTDLLERPARPLTRPRRVLRDLGVEYAANGVIGLVFSSTGPVA